MASRGPKSGSRSLTGFSDEELQSEIWRRLQARDDEAERDPLPYCYDCKHFAFWKHPNDPPDEYNACSKGHKMLFRTPLNIDEAHRGEWGHYLRRCKDRVTDQIGEKPE